MILYPVLFHMYLHEELAQLGPELVPGPLLQHLPLRPLYVHPHHIHKRVVVSLHHALQRQHVILVLLPVQRTRPRVRTVVGTHANRLEQVVGVALVCRLVHGGVKGKDLAPFREHEVVKHLGKQTPRTEASKQTCTALVQYVV